MGNVLTIAEKEVKSYFQSPIAYIIIGFFSLIFGYFFVALLSYFVSQSMQMQGMGGSPALNINQQLIAPVFLNTSVVALFVIPSITMRTYSEEKRSGTIELLLTSPLTDFQIIMGKFIGAMVLWAAMLAVTTVHIALLFIFGEPEVMQVLTVYLGMLLMGGCFVSVGLFISSLTKNQVVSAMVTFAVFLLLWVIDWISSFTGPTAQQVLTYLSIPQHLDDFTRGVLDTQHLVYYLSFITFGLFLTARSVGAERWRG